MTEEEVERAHDRAASEPDNPAEVLRAMAEGIARELGLEVDHKSFDDWSRMLSEPSPVVIVHHPGCRADYPEKPEGEAPREIQEVDLEDGYKAWVCKDCGASTSTLPPLEDPYWDDVREEIGR